MPDKKTALSKLADAKKQNLFDSEMDELVSVINSFDEYYTTSCCAGRIVVSESSSDNRKKSYAWLGKWHREVSADEILSVVSKHKKGVLWLSVEPVIVHVVCETMDSASKILKSARASGLKRSGIYQVEPRIIVEVIGVDGFSAPIGSNGKRFAGEKHIDFLVRLANKKIVCNREKRDAFLKELGCEDYMALNEEKKWR
ncbi:MAG: hypothetical protein KAT83_01025 [Candidatus Aenigmarchaeota archaeon]|nr:hypothetical protein [Candidatus Aenigmarchaeota archaeon]